MAELKTLNTIDTSPFKRLVLNLGAAPTAFTDGMTYYELLAWLVKYLEEEVVPKTNENIEAVKELQTYVSTYFDNLDVQEEINNKLDQMAEDGTLSEIVTAYLNIKSILAYDTVADMKAATNIVNGSFLKTYGKSSTYDGNGQFYKVREIRNTDVVDEENIIALADENLVAILIGNTQLENLTSSVSLLSNKKYIFIGDSYVTGSLNGEQFATDGWAKRIKDKLNLDNSSAYIFGEGGAGFVNTGHDGHNFQTLLSSNLDSITNKNEITHIVICGGYNDRTTSETDINTALNNIKSIIDNNFPNAKLYVGMIGFTNEVSANGTSSRNNLFRNALPNYQNVIKYNGFYLNHSECILDRNLMGTDNIHPSETGYDTLANGLIQILATGDFNKNTSMNSLTIENTSNTITQNLNFIEKISDNKLNLIIVDALGDGGSGIVFTNSIDLSNGTKTLLGHITNAKYLLQNYGVDLNNIPIYGYLGSTNNYYITGVLSIENDDVYVRLHNTNSTVTQGNRLRITGSIERSIVV